MHHAANCAALSLLHAIPPQPTVPMLGKHLKLHRMLLRSLPEDMFLMLLSIEVMMMVNACVHSVMSFLLYISTSWVLGMPPYTKCSYSSCNSWVHTPTATWLALTWQLDDGWPESVEEQGLLLLVWRRNFRNDLWKMCHRQSRRGVSRQDIKKCKTIVCIADTQKLLDTKVFTHRNFYTSSFYTDAFTHRRFYRQRLLLTETCTHRRFYIQTLLHRHVYTQTRLHTDAFTHRDFYTHRNFYTQTLLHTETFTHTDTFYTQTLLHTDAFTQRDFYTHTHRRFYTQTLSHTEGTWVTWYTITSF